MNQNFKVASANNADDDTLAIGQLKKFARLYRARKKIREKEKELNKKIQDMQVPLIDHLIDHGMVNVPLKGGQTIYMSPRYVPKKKSEDITSTQITQALIMDGLADLVSEGYNAKRLSSYLGELYKADQPLPKHLSEVIDIEVIINLIAKGEG